MGVIEREGWGESEGKDEGLGGEGWGDRRGRMRGIGGEG